MNHRLHAPRSGTASWRASARVTLWVLFGLLATFSPVALGGPPPEAGPPDTDERAPRIEQLEQLRAGSLDPSVDEHRARDLLSECAVASRYVYLDKPVVVLVNQVVLDNYVAIRLRLKCYVLDTRYEKELGTDITLRAMDAFRDASIEAPALLVQPLEEAPR